MSHHRIIPAHLAGSTVRVEDGTVVADTVLLVGDRVILPSSARGILEGEFVPAEVLAREPEIWNGTVVTSGHPSLAVSIVADRAAAARIGFGTVRNARFRDGRLVAELALSPTRAQAVGPDAIDIIERLRAGRMVEVSVGAFVTMSAQAGIADGQRFNWIWQAIEPDHVAALRSDQLGACSGSMGCGIGRQIAAQAATTAPSFEDVLLAVRRAEYQRESLRIAHAAAASPPPDGYTEALTKLRRQPASPVLDNAGIPLPYSTALKQRR